MPAYAFSLPLRTEEDLRQYVWLTTGVRIPDVRVCPHHTTPWRAFADAYFARSTVAVWKGSRGFGGKTFLLALLGKTEGETLKVDVTVLGGSGEQSRRVLEAGDRFWRWPNAPRHLLSSDPGAHTVRFRWGNTIRALQASQRSARGAHPQRLRLDEVDEMALPIFDAAMGQPMEGARGVPVQTVASSTHQNPNGTMTEILKRAAEKGWPVYEWCWRESVAGGAGWLAETEVAAKRRDVTDLMWLTEYELQEPTAADRAINTEAVERLFVRELGEFQGRDGELIEIEAPQAGRRYVHGVDWAKAVDWTIITTVRVDLFPAVVVAWERLGRREWPDMVDRFRQRVARWKGIGRHDGTGIGSVVEDYLPAEWKATTGARGEAIPGIVEPVILVGATRSGLFAEYIAEIEHGGIVAPRIDWMRREHLYVRHKDLTGGGHPPDSFVAGALAERARRVAPALAGVPEGIGEGASYWRRSGT